MLWVVTFSAFLPSLTSSSVVWLNPSAGQNPSSSAHSQIRFMIGLPWLKPEYPIWASVWRILRFSCPGHNEIAASCKVRMSGLRKVGMSAFMGGRGPHGNGAHRIESTRTGPLESVAGRGAGAFNAGGSGRTDTFV